MEIPGSSSPRKSETAGSGLWLALLGDNPTADKIEDGVF
jgi:hypothetical protein